MEDPIEVRNATEDDLQEIYDVERRCFKDPYPKPLLRVLLALYPELFMVAVDRRIGRVVGYVTAIVRAEGCGHVISLCVSPNYGGRGIGKKLMRAVEEVLRRAFKLCSVRLEVRVSNTVAVSLYKKLGYEVRGVIPKYYADGEDAYLMMKNLCVESEHWGPA